MAFKFSWKINIIINLVTFIAAYFFREQIFGVIMDFYINLPIIFEYNNFLFFLSSIILVILICVFHELLHGMIYKVYGGKVKFGFKLGLLCPYTQEISGIALSRNRFVMILLVPLFAIAFISLILPSWLGNMILLINTIGCIGDIYMTIIILKQKECKIIDRPYGFDVIYK